jgi:hypothetical protein
MAERLAVSPPDTPNRTLPKPSDEQALMVRAGVGATRRNGRVLLSLPRPRQNQSPAEALQWKSTSCHHSGPLGTAWARTG